MPFSSLQFGATANLGSRDMSGPFCLNVSLVLQSVRCHSSSSSSSMAAAAGRPKLGGGVGGPDEDQVPKQIQEASPEQCDQAVEVLTTVKAIAKAKQLQESQKSAKSIITRIWSMLLGIDPAFRAIASMSRDDDGKVTPKEVASAAAYLKHTLGKEGIQELITNLSKDGKGKILVEDIVKLGSQVTDSKGARPERT